MARLIGEDDEYDLVSPFNTGINPDPNDQILQTKFSLGLPQLSMPSLPTISPQGQSDLMNIAGILGGLGLGFYRPQVGDAAMRAFSGVNLMQDRALRRNFQQQQARYQRMTNLAERGIVDPDMNPDERAIAENTRWRIGQLIGEMPPGGQPGGGDLPPIGGPPSPPQLTGGQAPPVAMPGLPQAPPSAQPQVTPSSVPHIEANDPTPSMRGAAPSPSPLSATEGAPLSTEFFPGQPQFQPKTDVGKRNTYQGFSRSESINYGPAADQATNAAMNAVGRLFNDPVSMAHVRDQPQEFLSQLQTQFPGARLNDVQQHFTERVINTERLAMVKNNPKMHPNAAYMLAFTSAQNTMGGLFLPSERAMGLAGQSPSIDQIRAHAITTGDVATQNLVNQVEAQRSGAIKREDYRAEFDTRRLPVSDVANIPGASLGKTMKDLAGSPALTTQDMNSYRAIRGSTQVIKDMMGINAQIASSKAWKDLLGQKYDVVLARLLSAGDPKLVANVNAYEDYRQLFAVEYAKALGMVGTMTEIDRLVAQGVIPASGEFGPTARKKWGFILRDYETRLKALQPEGLGTTLEGIQKAAPLPQLNSMPQTPEDARLQEAEQNLLLDLRKPKGRP